MNGCIYRTTEDKCEFWSDCGKGIVSYCDFDGCEEKKPSNADRIRSTKTEEELMKAIFHALNMSRQYTDSRLGMVEWLKDARWGYLTSEEQT